METRRLTNFSEGKALGILERAFRGTSYVAHPKVRLADVVAAEEGEVLAPGDRDYLLRAHLDFVVCDRSAAMMPVFAVEFDGPSHASEVQRVRDIRKNRLTVNAGLPLLRVGSAEIEEHDRLSLLGYMMARAVAWKVEAPSLHAEIESWVEEQVGDTQDEEAVRQLVAPEGFLDPAYDTSFQFHLRHLFPGVAAVSKRLWSTYRMSSLYDHERLSTCDYAMTGDRMGMEFIRGSYLFWHEFTIAQSDGKPIEFRGGQFLSGHPLHSDRVQFSVEATLQTQEDYDWSEPGVDYHARTGVWPFWTMALPGFNMHDVGESFTDYLCLRAAEEWAKSNLQRRSLKDA